LRRHAVIGYILKMKKALLFLLVILMTWDPLWAILGVKPLLPWQVEDVSRSGGQDVLHRPNIFGFTCPAH
jgi:hypothetical protein